LTVVQTCGDCEVENHHFETVGSRGLLMRVKNLKDLSKCEKLRGGLLADVNWPQEEYFINNAVEPVNAELKYWNESVATQGIEIPGSHIIKARQVGRTIGIPTANLSLDKKMIKKFDLYPGVYYGKIILYFDDSCRSQVKDHEALLEKMGPYLNKVNIFLFFTSYRNSVQCFQLDRLCSMTSKNIFTRY
jgi:hypothetical protein